jgi:hypothetical protein
MAEDNSTVIRISLLEPGADETRVWLNELSNELAKSLSVQPRWDTPTKKGLDPSQVDWNTILLSVFASSGLLIEIIKLISDKIGQKQKVVIEIDGDRLELEGVKLGSMEQKLMIQEWIKRKPKENNKKK